ncbi:Fkbp4 [Symbiodinium pilosum]|uniref:Fkbp4 protein n=1 Tax=Symbiodinium pilosum TaxID=2952 RepID=A0A812VL50_SYMPI|nr:Fkbp4 [Symbiodinium pilosum]
MVEEQLKQAEAFKEEGNRFHAEGNYKRALGAYHKVFCFVNGLTLPPAGQENNQQEPPVAGSNQIPFDRVEDVKRLKQATRLNMAACYLKVGDFHKCVEACAGALDFGANSKAYFRRAQANMELRNWSDAVTDLEKARSMAPEDTGILTNLRTCRRNMKQGDAEERQRYAGMFGSPAADSPVEAAETVAEAAPQQAPPAAEKEAKQEEEVPSAPLATPTPARAERRSEARDLGEAHDEAKKLDRAVRELTYAWQQTDDEVKVYVSFDQSDDLSDVKDSQVQAEFGEWSASLLINVEGGVPFGLRLADFHRRVDPARCKCTVRSSRITLKLVKQESEHWWNFLQNSSPG